MYSDVNIYVFWDDLRFGGTDLNETARNFMRHPLMRDTWSLLREWPFPFPDVDGPDLSDGQFLQHYVWREEKKSSLLRWTSRTEKADYCALMAYSIIAACMSPEQLGELNPDGDALFDDLWADTMSALCASSIAGPSHFAKAICDPEPAHRYFFSLLFLFFP